MSVSFTFLALYISSFLLHYVLAAYPHAISIVQYWGQDPDDKKGNPLEKPLSYFCDGNSEAVIISFLNEFNTDGNFSEPVLDLGENCKNRFRGSSLLNCPDVGEDIKLCQSKGVRILLSLGGASGVYGFETEDQGHSFAATLWNLFGGGQSQTRPFGSAVVDGFDLDIEGGSSVGYVSLVQRLRQLYATDSSKSYYITASPQCPFPDVILGPVITSVAMDALHIQFYNNFCTATSDNLNFDVWDTWAKTESPNPDISLFLTIPGSPFAAASGYIPFDDLYPIIDNLASKYTNFAGVAIWDASHSYGNHEILPSYANGLREAALRTNRNESNQASQTENDISLSSPTSTSEAIAPHGTESATITQPSSGGCIQDGDVCAANVTHICSGNYYGICDQGKYILQPCPPSTTCFTTTDNTSIYCGTISGSDANANANANACHAPSSIEKQQNAVTTADDEKTVAMTLLTRDIDPPMKNKTRPTEARTGYPTYSKNVYAQITVDNLDATNFIATINARRLDNRPFGQVVMVKFIAAPGVLVTDVIEGYVQQSGALVMLLVKNPKEKSMSLVFNIFGSKDSTVFVAPNPKAMLLLSN